MLEDEIDLYAAFAGARREGRCDAASDDAAWVLQYLEWCDAGPTVLFAVAPEVRPGATKVCPEPGLARWLLANPRPMVAPWAWCY